MNKDIEYMQLARSCGVYGTDWHDDILEFAYSVAQRERDACAKQIKETARIMMSFIDLPSGGDKDQRKKTVKHLLMAAAHIKARGNMIERKEDEKR